MMSRVRGRQRMRRAGSAERSLCLPKSVRRADYAEGRVCGGQSVRRGVGSGGRVVGGGSMRREERMEVCVGGGHG